MKTPTSLTAVLFSAVSAFAQCPDFILDDGSGGFTIGPSEFDAVMTWGNYFDVEPSCPWINEVSVSFAGSLPVGTPLTIIVYNDPDGDGDPTNAVPISAASHASQSTSTSTFATYPIRPTNVGPGGGFFVAVAAFIPQRQSAARMDQDTLGVRSWLFYDGDLLPDPGAAPFILRMSDSPFNGTWMVRARGQADGCAVDLDGDGLATTFDFLAFQNAFNTGDLLADFDGDLALTFADFLAFQALFAAGC